MPGRSVDLVASAPPPLDPYGPGASVWGLAAALAAEGDDVRVLHLPGTAADRPPPGVTGVPVELRLRRPGAPVEPSDFAAAAGRLLRRSVDLVLRDPVGLGSLGLARGRHGPLIGGFARELELKVFEAERQGRPSSGWVDRLESWSDHRAVRRLERVALVESDRIFYDSPEVARSLSDEYAIPARKLLALPPAVPPLPTPPSRGAARDELRIPADVPVVVAPTAFEAPGPSGVDRVLEAFRRVRPFFPGVRLVLTGVAAATDPGVIALPDRSGRTLSGALAAADVAVFARRVRGFDPGVVLAARASVSPVVLPDAILPVEPSGGVRISASEDPGDLASVLAELLADPATRREVATAAERFSEAFLPSRVVKGLNAAVARLAA